MDSEKDAEKGFLSLRIYKLIMGNPSKKDMIMGKALINPSIEGKFGMPKSYAHLENLWEKIAEFFHPGNTSLGIFLGGDSRAHFAENPYVSYCFMGYFMGYNGISLG